MNMNIPTLGAMRLLTEDDLDRTLRSTRQRRTSDAVHTEFADTMPAEPVRRLPRGCDQQGRHPEAAHAASEIDDDSEFGALEGLVRGRNAILAPWIVIALAAVAIATYPNWWPF